MPATMLNETLDYDYTRVANRSARESERARRDLSNCLRWKSRMDRALAAALLIPCLPIIGLLVLLVRLTSHGPGIYRQTRVGKDGRVFTMYKIRSMRSDAETGTGAVWSKRHDPRVTLIGRVLRRSHLDEFPQLFNVLKGDMSLVGPRPERPEFVGVLKGQLPRYCERLLVPPGITGLAQLNLPPDSDLNDVRRKLTLDLEYVEHIGLFLDLRIILATLARVLKVPALGILGLRRQVPDFGDGVLLSAGTPEGTQSQPIPSDSAPSVASNRPAPHADLAKTKGLA